LKDLAYSRKETSEGRKNICDNKLQKWKKMLQIGKEIAFSIFMTRVNELNFEK